jgi:hypothetical protein
VGYTRRAPCGGRRNRVAYRSASPTTRPFLHGANHRSSLTQSAERSSRAIDGAGIWSPPRSPSTATMWPARERHR